jgi:hypothetical protein
LEIPINGLVKDKLLQDLESANPEYNSGLQNAFTTSTRTTRLKGAFMFRKSFKLFLPLLVLMLAALACGGSEPITVADVPVFEGANPIKEGQSTVAEAVVTALESSADQEGVTAEATVYSVPDGKTWDDIKNFYGSQLGSEWKADDQLTQTEEGFNTAGWTRGGLASEQALIVAWVNDPIVKKDFMVLVLFSE